MCEAKLDRQFVRSVFTRAQSSAGIGLVAKTIEDYTHRVMTLQKLGLIPQISDPDLLFDSLRKRYTKPTSLLTIMRPAMVFLTNLTEVERDKLHLQCSLNETARSFKTKVTQLNLENKSRVQTT